VDTITHGLAGAVLGRAAVRENAALAVAVGAVAAMFPDCDAFFIPGSPPFTLGDTLSYLEYHRGPTHSFLLAPVFALAIAGIAKIFFRRAQFGTLAGVALLAILSHIFLDWITSYGTMFFSPVSWKRYALDWVFILDPFFTGILVLTLLLAVIFRNHAAQEISIAGSVLLAAYIGFCAIQHRRALSVAGALMPGLSPGAYAALPQPFSPFRWALFADSGDSIRRAYVDIGPFARAQTRAPVAPPRSVGQAVRELPDYYPPPSAAQVDAFPTEERAPAVEAARQFHDVRTWYRFARFPVAALEPSADGATRVTLTDLRFSGPWRRTAFQYEAIISPQGDEVSSGFVRAFVTQPARRR
jgi:inner membrane protein